MARAAVAVTPSSRRRLVIHAGTPKTGTTTLQLLLGAQCETLATRGILVPRAGRGAEPHMGAHHAFAHALLTPEGVHAPADGLGALLAELAASRSPVAVVSSENFCWLALHPHLLPQLRIGLERIAYDATIVLYVREQMGFAESVYAEFVKQGMAWDVDAYLAAVNDRTSAPHVNPFRICFDYVTIADRFAEAFGRENVRVRPFDAAAPGEALVDDFASIIRADDVPEAPLVADGALHNPRFAFLDLLARLRDNAETVTARTPSVAAILRSLDHREDDFAGASFAFLGRAESATIGTTFADVNDALARRYGIAVPERSPPNFEARLLQARALRVASICWDLTKI